MITVIISLFVSQKVGQPELRQMRLIKNTPAPIVTDGFVGVCCKSIMKIYSNVKLTMLWCDERLGKQD
jgi:hypothetical protein